MIANVNSKLIHFRRIRCLINLKAALLIFKCTILPVIKYDDFVQDQGVVYINKSVNCLQSAYFTILRKRL